MFDLHPCSRCQQPTAVDHLAAAQDYAFWHSEGGLCPACLQQALLELLLAQGDAALHAAVQTVWPLDSEAAFGALPTPLRLHADPRFIGRGVTLALIDAGFYPHPDLVQPYNRIRAWVDAGRVDVPVFTFTQEDQPQWPDWNAAHPWQWHGLMTSVVAAGNGFLSHGLYRGLASAADLVLIQVRDEEGRITNATITRALRWVQSYGAAFGVRVVSLSVAGDAVWPLQGNPVDEAVTALIDQGITVVAAAGNNGERRLVPPATAPLALTIGGIDDHSLFDHDTVALWHSNYGESSAGALKPELVAPGMWVVAPLLPNTAVAAEAAWLFAQRRRSGRQGDYSRDERVAELKLVTPHYQHVEGTSFAAPVVAGAVACLLEAKPALTPRLVRELLQATAQRAPHASVERQGAGVLDVGRAVAMALQETHTTLPESPHIGPKGVTFFLHDHHAQRVQVLGDWDGWQAPGLVAQQIEAGLWQTQQQRLPSGQYSYKFLIDEAIWLADPANPWKAPDHFGGLNSVFRIDINLEEPIDVI